MPFSRYGILAEIHASGRVLTEEHTEAGTRVTVMISREDTEALLRRYGPEILSQ